MRTIDSSVLDSQFRNDVANTPGGENLTLCYACGTCTAGCPVSDVDPEFNPRRIIRQVLLGMREEVLQSPVIWRCVQCYSCTAKCPQSVRFREIVRALRTMAVAAGHVDPSVPDDIEAVGRLVQRLRREMAQRLVTDRPSYDAMKQQVEELLGPDSESQDKP